MKKIIQQAFFQLRNQPLLSVITVLGTALAIALIMVIFVSGKDGRLCPRSEPFPFALCQVGTYCL